MMTLNRQLLLVSLILLSLPWAGCQYLQEMDAMMRASQERALMATSHAVATVLAQQSALLYPQADGDKGDIDPAELDPQGFTLPSEHLPAPLYFHPLAAPSWVDGYDDGWEQVPLQHYQPVGQSVSAINYRTATVGKQLLFFMQITDDQLIYNDPSQSPFDQGDRLILTTGNGQRYVFSSAAPGKVTARFYDGERGVVREPAIAAYWQDTEDGFSLEISLPRALAAGGVGFMVVDDDRPLAAPSFMATDSSAPITTAPIITAHSYRYGHGVEGISPVSPRYIVQPQALAQALAALAQTGQRLTVIDGYYWPLGQRGSVQQNIELSGHWLLRRLYRSLLNAQLGQYPHYPSTINKRDRNEVSSAMLGVASSHWYQSPSQPDQYIVASAVPVMIDVQGAPAVVAVVVAEQSSEQLAALSDSAFNRLLLLSFGAISAVALGLLGYASLLSWRIRGLSRAATEVLDADGRLLDNFPVSRAADEIGELSRNYAQLLRRLKDYTDYLQTLARKLSHELRTPLAIIHSSLDNLQSQPLDSQAAIYQQRAKDGALRLGAILTAMSEATRVEQSLAEAESEPVDMLALLSSVSQAYQDLYPDYSIALVSAVQPSDVADFKAVPDLLVQMLDKLVDNAAGFSPIGGRIELQLSVERHHLLLAVVNDGPLLPEKMRDQLFDNMVSMRESNQHNKPPQHANRAHESHLGLGLYIVKLIVDFHQGSIIAANKADGSGVVFTVYLPRG